MNNSIASAHASKVQKLLLPNLVRFALTSKVLTTRQRARILRLKRENLLEQHSYSTIFPIKNTVFMYRVVKMTDNTGNRKSRAI